MKVYKLTKYDKASNTMIVEFSEENVFTANVLATFPPNPDGSMPSQAISDFIYRGPPTSDITVVQLF